MRFVDEFAFYMEDFKSVSGKVISDIDGDKIAIISIMIPWRLSKWRSDNIEALHMVTIETLSEIREYLKTLHCPENIPPWIDDFPPNGVA